MALNLQAVRDAPVDQNFRQLGQRFPIQVQDLATEAQPKRFPFTIELFGPESREAEALSGDLSFGGTGYYRPGSAASASTQSLEPEVTASVVKAYWDVAWTPNSKESGIRLETFKENFEETEVIAELTNDGSASPVHKTVLITSAIQNAWNVGREANEIRFLGHKLKNNSEKKPFVYMSRIVMVLGGGSYPNETLPTTESPLTPRDAWAPTNSYETYSRASSLGSELTSTELLVSGQLWLAGGAVIPAGKEITSISWRSGSVALETGSNQWFAIYRQSDLALLGVTSDDTSTAWAANTLKTLNLATPYTPIVDTPVYIGAMVKATKVPSLWSCAIPVGAAGIRAAVPILAGASGGAGLTNPASAPNPAGAITSARNQPYAYCTAA